MSAVPPRARYWPVQLVRATLAVVAGLVVTFSADHTARFGLIVFGLFALTTGLVLGWGSVRIDARAHRAISFLLAAVSVLCGIAALALNATGPGTLFLLIILFGATTGFLELYLGIRARGHDQIARDWLTVGIMTALLALAVLLVPADYALPWSAENTGSTVTGILTSQIIVVGIFGAYAILVGVYLAIAGLSSRWTNTADSAPTETLTGQ